MYMLFPEVGSASSYHVISPPDLPRIQRGLQLSIETVIGYRRQNPGYLPNQHILNRLLNSINIHWDGDPDVYVTKVRDVALARTVSFGWTSSLAYGRLHATSSFYGNNVQEVIYATDEDFDVEEAVENWTDLEPIRVLSHPLTDLWCHVPDGETNWNTSGISVVVINVPMLALQRQLWLERERRRSKFGNRNGGNFLQEIPLPNMLYSHVDIAIANRCYNWLNSIPSDATSRHHPFHLVDWSKPVDKVIELTLETIAKRKLTFDQIIDHLPTSGYCTLRERLRLPMLHWLQQPQWAILLARLSLVAFLVQMNTLSGSHANKAGCNQIRRYLLEFNQARLFQSVMSKENQAYVKSMLEDQIVPYL